MAHNKDEGYSVDPITREDLDKALDRQSENIKQHINDLISPIIKEQEDVRTILTGRTRMNGLVGGVKTMAINLKVIYTLLGFICVVIVKKIFL